MGKVIASLIVSLFLAACASSTEVSQPIATAKSAAPFFSAIEMKNNGTEAPDHFLLAVKSHLKQALVQKAAYSEQGGDRVVVTVTDYRMRSGFTRAFFGVLAGKDGIDSEVTILSPNNGTVVGKSKVSSYNVLAIGDMDDIARMHAEEIAKFLTGSQD